MTSYSSLRPALVTALNTVTNIGMVQNRERFIVDLSKYLNMFSVTIGGVRQVRGWMVLRETCVPVYDTAFGEQRRRHGFLLYGILGFSDNTDTYGTMQTLCDEVMAVMDNQTTLNSTPGILVRAVGPCSLRSFRSEQFGSVLCHVAEIDVPIETMLPLGTA